MPRNLTRALKRLEGTNFACPEPPMPCGNGEVRCQEAWLLIVVEALDAFVHSDDWMKK